MKLAITKTSNLEDQGGYAEFFKLDSKLGFKQFPNKKAALKAYKNQKLLSKYKLAPKVYGTVQRIPIKLTEYEGMSNWGFVTGIAKTLKELKERKFKELQTLVDNIEEKTKLKFWDCHVGNIGYFNKRLVCIDTGTESFVSEHNAWGFETPGPKCKECNKFVCNCDNI